MFGKLVINVLGFDVVCCYLKLYGIEVDYESFIKFDGSVE